VLTRLNYITERAQKHTEEVFTNLYHLLTYELLWYAFRKQWLRANLTTPIGEAWATLNRKLQGHYQYYGVTDNWR